MNGGRGRASGAIQPARSRVRSRSNREPIQTQRPRTGMEDMLKTLTAALVAASVLIAPIAASAETAPATKPATTTTKVVKVKGHKRHFAGHHKHRKVVKHVHGHNKVTVIK